VSVEEAVGEVLAGAVAHLAEDDPAVDAGGVVPPEVRIRRAGEQD
jgi:hypothetical protein